MQKHVNLVDLVKSFPTNIYLQNLAFMQKRTSPVKFAHLAEKSEKGSIWNLSTKVKATEEARRDRENRVAAGDESAKLVFTAPAHAAPQQHARGKGLPPISAVPGVGRPLPAMRPV